MKLLIFTGFSQISQSAAALAAACRAARQGQRVLLASVGPAHLTGALLGQVLGPRPLELEPNLAAMEVKAVEELGARWDEVRPSLRSGLVARLREIGPEEIPAFPGMDAIGGLLIAEKARQTGRFDLVVLDGPPPDSFVRALTLPDVLRWLTRLIFGLDRGAGRSRMSQEQAIIPTALLAPTAVSPLQDLRVELEAQRSRLDAGTGTRVRLVVTPDELAFPPVRAALTALGLFNMAVDEVVVPGSLDAISAELRAEFDPTLNVARPTLRAAMLPTSVAELATWAERGAALYGDLPVYDAERAPRPPHSDRELKLFIPFLEAKDLEVALANEEVVVQIGPLRRHVLLPGIVNGGNLRAKVDPKEVLRLWVD
ncbi:MAG: ArsA-related P-loop ATPase [Oscillochloridaceae bacterium umkhey_bin13]